MYLSKRDRVHIYFLVTWPYFCSFRKCNQKSGTHAQKKKDYILGEVIQIKVATLSFQQLITNPIPSLSKKI